MESLQESEARLAEQEAKLQRSQAVLDTVIELGALGLPVETIAGIVGHSVDLKARMAETREGED